MDKLVGFLVAGIILFFLVTFFLDEDIDGTWLREKLKKENRHEIGDWWREKINKWLDREDDDEDDDDEDEDEDEDEEEEEEEEEEDDDLGGRSRSGAR